MTAPLTRDGVAHLAKLARLALDDALADRVADDLGRILAYVAILDEADVTNVPPASEAVGARLPLRADDLRLGVEKAVALAAAPHTDGDGFVVPTFVEE